MLSFFVLFLCLEFLIVVKSNHYSPAPSDAALILGNALEEGSIPSAITEERLKKGLELYQDGFCNTIIVSGGKGPRDTIAVAEAMKLWLMEQGVPSDHILAENQSKNTKENILFSKILAEQKDLNSIIIITSDFHIYRSMQIAKANFDEITGAAAQSHFSFSTLLWFLREPFSLIKYYLFDWKNLPSAPAN